jgi:hypothetical protein
MMTNVSEATQFARVERERDLYLKLLDLGRQNDLGAFLEEALRSIVRIVEARQGYLEIYTDETVEDTSRWWMVHGFTGGQLSGVRAAVSTGIIAKAEWPGNVRQLAHAFEAAVIRAAGTGATKVERLHLFPEAAASSCTAQGDLTYQEATRQFQAALLAEMLEETGWNVVETARRLDLARSHAYTLVRAFGLRRDCAPVGSDAARSASALGNGKGSAS